MKIFLNQEWTLNFIKLSFTRFYFLNRYYVHSPKLKTYKKILEFPGKNTGVGCHFLLQGIIPTQGSNPGLLIARWILYHWATWEARVIDYSLILKEKSMVKIIASVYYPSRNILLYAQTHINIFLHNDSQLYILFCILIFNYTLETHISIWRTPFFLWLHHIPFYRHSNLFNQYP